MPLLPSQSSPHGPRNEKWATDPRRPLLHAPMRTHKPRPTARMVVGRTLVFALSTMAFAFALYFLWLLSATNASRPARRGPSGDKALGYTPTTPDLGLPDRIAHSLAQYSPYWPVDKYTVPRGCAVDQVNIVRAHSFVFVHSVSCEYAMRRSNVMEQGILPRALARRSSLRSPSLKLPGRTARIRPLASSMATTIPLELKIWSRSALHSAYLFLLLTREKWV